MTARRKHTPMRTCVICREQTEKRSLVRIVRTESGVFVDSSGKMNGRGTYVCEKLSCQQRMLTNDVYKHIGRALRVELSDADRERIRQAVAS